MTYCLFISKNFHQSQRLVPHYWKSAPPSLFPRMIRRHLTSIAGSLSPKNLRALWNELADAYRSLPNPPDYVVRTS